MNSNYVAEIQSTGMPDEQHVSGDIVSVDIQVARSEYVFPGDMCPGVNAALLTGTGVHGSTFAREHAR